MLQALRTPGSHATPAFDRLTRLVTRLLGAPVSLISLLDAEQEYVKSAAGLAEPWRTTRQIPLSHSFCQYVVASRAPLVVCDARQDTRVAGNAAILDLEVIAYAGVPLAAPDGTVLGALSAIDHAPRTWSDEDVALLQDLAAGVMTEIALGEALTGQQRAEATLDKVLAHLPDAVWFVDSAHQLIRWNTAYAELHRRVSDHPLWPEMPLEDRLRPGLLGLWAAWYDRGLAGEAFTAEVASDGDGAHRWYELSFSPVRSGDAVVGVSVIGRDITARREEAAALRRLAAENAELYAAERASREETERAAERATRLSAVTAALVQAHTPAQVAEIVLGQGIAALGANAGALLLRQADDTLNLVEASGYPPEVVATWPLYAVGDPYPLAEAVRTGVAVWVGSFAESPRRYQSLPGTPGSASQALAAIPLLLQGRAVGGILLSFNTTQAFPDGDRAFMLALAEQCAQAFDRARLVESLQRELAERQRIEQVLRDNEARLDGVLRSAMDAIITVDAEQRIVRFNHAAERLFGYWAEDVVGQPLERLIPTRYREAHRQHVPAFGATGVSRRSMGALAPLTALRASGEEFPIEATISHIAIAGERWYTVILRDISERLAAEAALKASEARFTAFMNRIPAAAWICSADGVVRYANPSYTARLTPAARDPVGRHLRELYAHDVAETYLAAINEVTAHGQPQELTLSRPRHDGTLGQFLVYTFPLTDSDGAALVGGVAVDITERAVAEAQQRALERSLLEAQKLESLGVLAGGIAHDFNNLLMTILGNVELALLDIGEAHPAHAGVSQIRTASQRAAELTRQMLAYSGRGAFVIAPVEVNALVEELALLLRASTPKGVSLTYALDPGLPAVEADATQLRQVLMNLVINGAEAIGGEAGHVTIWTRLRRVGPASLKAGTVPAELAPGTYVAIEVTDTGSGMDAATRERMFEPFFTTKFTGRGLGLAAVQGIVHAHRGAILVDSSPGQGTTFTVLLPTSTARPATPIPALLPAVTTQTVMALIIDDEPEVRGVTTRMLERSGYQVCAAPDGESGLAQLIAHPEIRVVLLDLTMPGLSGEETLRRLRTLRADVPVVVVSGYSAQEVRSRVEGVGVVEVLQKPFTPAQLREVLHRVRP